MRQRFFLIIIILIAVILRLYNLNWDWGYHLHPDERQITIVATQISLNDLNPHFFAYGSFPIYLLKVFGWLTNHSDYQDLNLVGRYLSAIFDLGTLVILFLLGRKLFNNLVGLMAAFLYSLSVLPIQLSHFYAVDTILTFFVVLTLYCLVHLQDHLNLKWIVLLGISFGLALSTKTSALPLVIPILITFILQYKRTHSAKMISLLFVFCFLSLTLFLLTEPYALLDSSTFIKQTLEQQAMTKSAFTFPYTLQYVGKVPVIYEIKNIFFWGVGPFISLLILLGGIYLHQQIIKRQTLKLIPLLAYFWIYFFIISSFAIGFMRYLLPIYPLLCLFGGFFLYKLFQFVKIYTTIGVYCLLSTVYCLLVLVWPLSFISIYSQANTRISASNYIYQNIPSGSKILTEHWDDGLPLDYASYYQIDQLTLYDPDNTVKWQKITAQLKEYDYIIIASNRLYTPLQKLTNCNLLPVNKCYQKTANYYQKLFNGDLGFTKIAEFEVRPRVPLTAFFINDESADESFTVYDHPKVMIFKKTSARLQNIDQLL